MPQALIYELSVPGRRGVKMPAPDVPEAELPGELVRDKLPLPEVSQRDIVRHYLHLSQLNYSVDTGFYPLGSCTMKYNPILNDEAAELPGFALTHPLQDPQTAQGNLALMLRLQEFLKEIGGFAGVSLQPAAGAQGELAGILMIRAYHLSRGDTRRSRILVPDSAHGTNPASTAMAGYTAVQIPSDEHGNVDLEELARQCDDTVAGLMLTNPNTLGLFDEGLEQIVRLVHACGGLVYGDGANMNALLGVMRPGDAGIDVLHYNLHKTFSTPHGGGGPGSGPVGAAAHLVDFLPGPIAAIEVEDEDELPLYNLVMPSRSIGRLKAFYGQFGILVRAYTYVRVLGAEGLRRVAEHAVLNANYLQARLRDTYPIPHAQRLCMHEFVAQGILPGSDVRAMDIAKRLIDTERSHPPTVYFPLIVKEALMIEPTETESKQVLDEFVRDMNQIAEEARANPQRLHEAPHTAPLRRLDEVRAARNPILCAPQALNY
ncbi:MAG: aminomethyl-transferring glycine dehydrogenase subunit GcvPB [Thermoflexales bacterium]|nr:aminomethyl-transferring glycine dehydrogenase subunit GcvPB [Thermoflexales bacterium]